MAFTKAHLSHASSATVLPFCGVNSVRKRTIFLVEKAVFSFNFVSHLWKREVTKKFEVGIEEPKKKTPQKKTAVKIQMEKEDGKFPRTYDTDGSRSIPTRRRKNAASRGMKRGAPL